MSFEKGGSEKGKGGELISLADARRIRAEEFVAGEGVKLNNLLAVIENARRMLEETGLQVDEQLVGLLDARVDEFTYEELKLVRERLGRARIAYDAAIRVLDDRERSLVDAAVVLLKPPAK